MQKRFYTLVFAHDPSGRIRKLNLSTSVIHLILAAALVGAATILVGVLSYAHLLLTVTDYRSLRAEGERLRRENQGLLATTAEARERLDTLESLANEVAVSYGLMRVRQTPFGTLEPAGGPFVPVDDFRETLARYRFLQHNVAAVNLIASGAQPMPGQDLSRLAYLPSLWPVRGRFAGGFGDRMDPFNGEGSFHAGIDISSDYGAEVRAAADGVVVAAEIQGGYGRVVVIDHGAGLTTWYGHLSAFRAQPGQLVQRGAVIGYVGTSGRSTGPHLHYEIRLYDAPVNPWRFLRSDRAAAHPLPSFPGGG